ncbi:MAG TPA: D-aminoacyl-tRNA deacylase [Victivallales bacterium]|nr:D-aminoacyl-tRNA deacylase [Victivallales bacterium]HRR06789.1 D-aminoacyl-tRNA deacylase [Victivallales bacterium]HRR29231.1 D-aminoacyl-tRNA deacylase [Victivallales bacterium]HRU01615.1 D-aminoacyl-tRNA deacylase [Victivallales bacterium]
MKAVIQRVNNAEVKINSKIHSSISKGLLILLGISVYDTDSEPITLALKCINLRIFDDENGKMNLSVTDIKGEVMVVSQFTLFADARRGRRPSYSLAAPPDKAVPLYEKFVNEIAKFAPVKTGVFGADMKICLENDGPVTIILDSFELKQ